jgi:uncharacterized protein DUF11/HYR domain-containing protein
MSGRESKYSAKRPGPNILAGVFIILAGGVSLPAVSSSHRSKHTESFTAPTIYAADCTTPKTTFNLGETVCAKANGLTGLRFQWVDPDGFSVSTTNISNDPQNDLLVLPSSDQSTVGFFTANNLGRWRVNAITLRNSASASAFFTVRDPNNPRADLSIVKSFVGSEAPVAGAPVQFFVRIENHGPNDAVNAHFVDNSYSNATFKSLSQNSGPSFTCNGADCRIASFLNGAEATFTLNFTAGNSGGVMQNTATVSSDTPELNPKDNSSTSPPVEVGTTGPPPTCHLVVTAPPSVTLFTGPGAPSCAVTVNNLDATLGTGSATDNCDLVGGVTRTGVPSGNMFPVGVTTLTYAASDTEGNTSSAIQQVTVVDNTPPNITCPANLTLEPTCPSGAVAMWTAPVGTDNCPGATTVQTAGPGSGSVFPIGTTSVAYKVSDAAGNQASCGFNITVLTVQATMQKLEASINASSLKGPQKLGLLPKLVAANDAINRGNTKAACNVLSTFINSVQKDVAKGDVPAAQGQAWIDSATHVRNTIGCTSNPCS